jgi:hypothetical protein
MIQIVVNNYFYRCCIYTTLKKPAVYAVFSTSIYDLVFVVKNFIENHDQSVDDVLPKSDRLACNK